MEISISNIAWDVEFDTDIYEILKKNHIRKIDIAPPKYFTNPAEATIKEISEVYEKWASKGISITGMQSLLFGTQGLNLFSDASIQKKMLNHLDNICKIGKNLNSKYLVFGSPKNRDAQGLSTQKIRSIYLNFFRQLGDIAATHDTIICLEPNPKEYGANFMTNSQETANVVYDISHPNIAMQLDTGAIFMNNEDPIKIIENHNEIIGHIHISEPKLAPVGSNQFDHNLIAKCIEKHLPHKTCTIEMLTSSSEQAIIEINSALEFTNKHYGSEI